MPDGGVEANCHKGTATAVEADMSAVDTVVDTVTDNVVVEALVEVVVVGIEVVDAETQIAGSVAAVVVLGYSTVAEVYCIAVVVVDENYPN